PVVGAVSDIVKAYAKEKWAEIQAVWDALQAVGKALWEQSAWERNLILKGWTWIKNKLGIGDTADGQNGLLQWAEAKLDAVWASIKEVLAPFSQQLKVI